MAQSVIQTSFAGGELSGNLFARVDLEKYGVGLQLSKNFFVDYRGGVSNRPGTEYIAGAASDEENGIRLWPFIFSREQSYVLEFSQESISIYSNGIFIDTLVAPWQTEDLFNLRFAQSADVLTITHPDYPIHNLTRTDAITFTLEEQEIGPEMGPASSLTATPTTAGTFKYGYTVTCISPNGEESLPCLPVVVDSEILDPTTNKVVYLSFTGPGTAVAAVNVYKWGPIPAGAPLPSVFGFIGQTVIASFTDNNIAPDFAKTPPEFRDPFSPGQVIFITVGSVGAGYDDITPLTIAGDGSGATAYALAHGGTITGVVITNPGKDYTAATAVQQIGTPGAGATFPSVGLSLDHRYPAAVGYYQQRRAYGGADLTPELAELSQIGHYSNHDISPSVLATDAITVNIASREVNRIKSFMPMQTGLITFTQGMSFLISGGGDAQAITPDNVSASPQAGQGCGDLQPIAIGYNVLYEQFMGSTIRDLTFNFGTQSYQGEDRTMLVQHLIKGFNLVDWAWAEEPFKLLWVVRGDGKCIVMTYVPDQEVYAWSRHETVGRFATVCAVPEGNETAVYFGIRRYTPGTVSPPPGPTTLNELMQLESEGTTNYVTDGSMIADWDRDQFIWLDTNVEQLNVSSTIDGSFKFSAYPGSGTFFNVAPWAHDNEYLYVGKGNIVVGRIYKYRLSDLALMGNSEDLDAEAPWNMGATKCADGQSMVITADISGSNMIRAWNMSTFVFQGDLHHQDNLGTVLFTGPYSPGMLWGLNCANNSVGTTTPCYIYEFPCVAGVAGFSTLTSFTPNDIIPGAASWADDFGIIYDETDGHLICLMDTNLGTRLIKVNSSTGAIMWNTACDNVQFGLTAHSSNNSTFRIRYGQLVLITRHLGGNVCNKYIFDTLTGAKTTVVFGGYYPGHQVYNDLTGAHIGAGEYAPAVANAPIAVPPTIPSGWISSQVRCALLGPLEASSPGTWSTTIERLAPRPKECCPQLSTFLDSAVYSQTTPGEFPLQIEWTGTGLATLSDISGNDGFGDLAIGDYVLFGCWTLIIDDIPDLNVATATVVLEGSNYTDEDLGIVVPAQAGEWSFNAPITSLSGLDHLVGLECSLICDGVLVSHETVLEANTTSFDACGRAVIGLPYSAKIKTLRLEAGRGTVQGKRKVIPAVTARLECSAGVEFGTQEGYPLYSFYEQDYKVNVGERPLMFTGDQRINVDATWSEDGILIGETTYPFACTILGLIPEVAFGDDQR